MYIYINIEKLYKRIQEQKQQSIWKEKDNCRSAKMRMTKVNKLAQQIYRVNEEYEHSYRWEEKHKNVGEIGRIHLFSQQIIYMYDYVLCIREYKYIYKKRARQR